MVPQPQIQLQQQMQMQQQMQQQMQPQMQQMQMQMHQQMPYMGSQASGYQDSRDSYGGDSYRSGGGGGGGGGYGGSSSYGSQSQGGRGGSGRPFQDISNLPPDDQSKVRPEIVEWRRRNEITVAGDCPGTAKHFKVCMNNTFSDFVEQTPSCHLSKLRFLHKLWPVSEQPDFKLPL